MKIFFPHIPTPINKQDLFELVNDALGGIRINPFGRRGRVGAYGILQIRDPAQSTLEYHGLVEVVPEHAARRLLSQLHGRSFRGRSMEPRAWVDRRSGEDDSGHSRRRPNLQLQMLDRVDAYTLQPESI